MLEEKDIFSHQHEIELEKSKGIRRQDTFKRKAGKFPNIKIVQTFIDEKDNEYEDIFESLDQTITNEKSISARSSQCSVDSSKTIVASDEVCDEKTESPHVKLESCNSKSLKFKSRKSKSLDHIFDGINVRNFVVWDYLNYFYLKWYNINN